MAGYRKMAATTDCKLQVEQCCEITVRLLKITFETVSHPHVTVRLDSEFTGSIWMNNAWWAFGWSLGNGNIGLLIAAWPSELYI